MSTKTISTVVKSTLQYYIREYDALGKQHMMHLLKKFEKEENFEECILIRDAIHECER